MGNFYGNVTLLDVSLADVRSALNQPAFAAVVGRDIVVYVDGDDDGPQSGQEFSERLSCVAVSAGVHDDDILFWEVHVSGRGATSGAIPDPAEYFGMDEEMLDALDVDTSAGAIANAATTDQMARQLVEATGRGDVRTVREVFDGDFVFATERHQALVKALGLPTAAVGWGFRYLSRDQESGRPSTVRIGM
jgi:hypothetical protein